MNTGLFGLLPAFNHNKRNTKQNQHNGNCNRIIEECMKNIIKQQPNYRSRYAGNQYLAPHLQNIFLHTRPESSFRQGVGVGFFLVKRPEIFPVDHNDRKNCTQLNDHIEHFFKCIAGIQFQEGIHQNQVSGAADGQPFGHTLDNA